MQLLPDRCEKCNVVARCMAVSRLEWDGENMFIKNSTKVASLGMTLIEVSIVILLVGIIASIAYPSYQQHLMRSHRANVQTDLLALQLQLEARYDQSNPSFINGYDFQIVSEGQCTVCTSSSNAEFEITSAATYTLQATSHFGDDDVCNTMTLTQAQHKAPTLCWGQ
jgi:type IV pilus assembly protein PilE